jgi:hypothetical protein
MVRLAGTRVVTPRQSSAARQRGDQAKAGEPDSSIAPGGWQLTWLAIVPFNDRLELLTKGMQPNTLVLKMILFGLGHASNDCEAPAFSCERGALLTDFNNVDLFPVFQVRTGSQKEPESLN